MRAMLAYLLCYDVICVHKKKDIQISFVRRGFFLLLLFSITFSMTTHNREATWNSGIFVGVFDTFIRITLGPSLIKRFVGIVVLSSSVVIVSIAANTASLPRLDCP